MRKKLIKYQVLSSVIAIPIILITFTYFVPGSTDYWLHYWWLAPIAFLIALTVNTVGISGAALFVPFFALIFPLIATPLSPLQSVKLGLITESFGLTSSALAFIVFGLVDKKLALISILGAVPFVVMGALVVNFIPESVLLLIIASALFVAVYLIKHEKTLKLARKKQHKADHIDLTVAHGERRHVKTLYGQKFSYCLTKLGYIKRSFGYGLGGLFQGSAGFGIGELGIISMLITDIPVKIAIGTSHLIVASTAIIASVIHVAEVGGIAGEIPWNIPFITIPAVIIGGQTAPHLAARLPTRALEKFVSILFIIIAIALIVLDVKKSFF